MMIENQAKLQALDRKGNSITALAIPNKQPDKDKSDQPPVQLPVMPPIDIYKYSGSELPIIERFIDTNLVEKDLPESKQARHHLGLGMPEARALLKRHHVKTFREIIQWYSNNKEIQGEKETQNELQKVICSSQITAKIIAIIILTGI